MTDNVTMVRTRADEVVAVYEHLRTLELVNGEKLSPDTATKLTEIAFSSIHSQMEGGRMASVMAEGMVNVSNAIGHLADTIHQNFGEQPQTGERRAVCKKCGKDCEAHHFVCDKDAGGEWCPECFNDTICGRGGHGEGCSTMILGSES